MPTRYEKIYATIRRIPKGRVATYGQIAILTGIPNQPRQVGYALNALPDELTNVPWHRVINAKGEISQRAFGGCEPKQRKLLEKEGVPFNNKNRVDLARYRWTPRPRK